MLDKLLNVQNKFIYVIKFNYVGLCIFSAVNKIYYLLLKKYITYLIFMSSRKAHMKTVLTLDLAALLDVSI